jgi:mono/diheme cytochrome c family protein
MIHRTILALACVLAIASAPAIPAGDGNKDAVVAKQASAAESMPKFDKAYLTNPKNIAAGQALWEAQCRHCHGAKAYPGKAPKLKPDQLASEEIFERVTNGFRKMPSWKTVFSRAQRMSVVAYIKSGDFSP